MVGAEGQMANCAADLDEDPVAGRGAAVTERAALGTDPELVTGARKTEIQENLVLNRQPHTRKQAVNVRQNLRMVTVVGQMIKYAVDLDEDPVAGRGAAATERAALGTDPEFVDLDEDPVAGRSAAATERAARRKDPEWVMGAWMLEIQENLVLDRQPPTRKQAMNVRQNLRMVTVVDLADFDPTPCVWRLCYRVCTL
jgi:hypothetical protein